MGYMHIENLYKYPDMMMFKEVYALEKIHGTSAHVKWKDGLVGFSPGGEKMERFVSVFNSQRLIDGFTEIGHEQMTVYGEAYGGKCQGMSGTYGKELKFVVFDVKVGDCWLNVPNAHDVTTKLGLEFVAYHKVDTSIEALNAVRDLSSVQALRNGINESKLREGVVLRPLVELTRSDGKRIMCKHKGEAFSETKTPREVDPDKLKVLENAAAIADEWVTPMRLNHVTDRLPEAKDMKHTGAVIVAMIEDVQREAEGEIAWSKDVEKAIGKATAKMYKGRVTAIGTH